MASRAAGGNVGAVGVGAGDCEEVVNDKDAEDAPVLGLVVVAETLCDTLAVVVTAPRLVPLEDDAELEAVEGGCVCSGDSDGEANPMEAVRDDVVDVAVLVVRLVTAVPLEDAIFVEFAANSDEAIDCEMDEPDVV